MAPPPNVVDKALYSQIHARIRKKLDSEGRQWGADTSAQLVNAFKRAGGRYEGSRNAQEEGLTKWFGKKSSRTNRFGGAAVGALSALSALAILTVFLKSWEMDPYATTNAAGSTVNNALSSAYAAVKHLFNDNNVGDSLQAALSGAYGAPPSITQSHAATVLADLTSLREMNPNSDAYAGLKAEVEQSLIKDSGSSLAANALRGPIAAADKLTPEGMKVYSVLYEEVAAGKADRLRFDWLGTKDDMLRLIGISWGVVKP